MNTLTAGAALLALSMCFGSVATAQQRQNHDRDAQRQVDRRGGDQDRQSHRRVFRNDDRHADSRQHRRVERRIDHRRDHRRAEQRHYNRDQWRAEQRNYNRGQRPFYGARDHRVAPRPVARSHNGYRRGAGPDHRYYRGGRLPAQFRSRHYVVDNWRGHRLNRPPRGYHWIQTGPDYVLAAITTGIILQIAFGH